MKESQRLVRIFISIVVWTLFACLTAAGLVTAAEKTEFVGTGREQDTVIYFNNL